MVPEKNSGLESYCDRKNHEKDRKKCKEPHFRLADPDNDNFALARLTKGLFYENYFVVGLNERNF